MTAAELAERLGGELHCIPGLSVTGFSLDSRDISPGCAFLAVNGARVDGHDFATEVLKAGASLVVAEREIDGPHILVPNLVRALAKFGQSYRRHFRGPVVGVTGSAGKTTAKESIAAALGMRGEVLKTVGNRNTEFTAPLLWAELEPRHWAAVIEMGMRGFGQIAHLASVSSPTIGVVTNIGVAHLDLVGSREGIARAKAELIESLPKDGHAVLWSEDDFIEELAARASCPVATFGWSSAATCRITSYRALGWDRCAVIGEINGQQWTAKLPWIGRHLAPNAAAAVLVAHLCGVDPKLAAKALIKVELPPMRMEVRTYNGATILLDTYNASPPSVLGALEALAETAKGRKLAVLGEMRELGEAGPAAHRDVARKASELDFAQILFVGKGAMPGFEEIARELRSSYTEDLTDVTTFLKGVKPGDSVLVKGSRALELERALNGLEMEATK